MMQLGFIGLGIMGKGMVFNLLKKNDGIIYGYDFKQDALKEFSENGGMVVNNVEEIYKKCNIIFLCLPTNEALEKSVKEIIEVANEGTIVVDMGSTSPYTIQMLHKAAYLKGIFLLDSPVSGGEVGAKNGTLTIMCGGEKSVYDKVLPYLNMMGKKVTYMGNSGYGSMAKLVNNMMVGIHLVAMSEAFGLAAKIGIDPTILFSAIKDGFAQSAVMDEKVPKILERDFLPGARIAVHYKDIINAMNVANDLKVEIPMTKIVFEQMEYMERNGMINEDQCALVKYYENTMGVLVRQNEGGTA